MSQNPRGTSVLFLRRPDRRTDRVEREAAAAQEAHLLRLRECVRGRRSEPPPPGVPRAGNLGRARVAHRVRDRGRRDALRAQLVRDARDAELAPERVRAGVGVAVVGEEILPGEVVEERRYVAGTIGVPGEL